MRTGKLLAIFLLAAFCSLARAEPLTNGKRADIEHLLEMTGAFAMGKQMATAVVASMSQTIKQARPDIPQRVIDLLPGEVMGIFDENIGSFKEAIIPIYHKYYTGPEIKEMIRFYSTELGQKTIRLMPTLMQEGMLAGQQWGRALGPLIDQRVRAKFKREGIQI